MSECCFRSEDHEGVKQGLQGLVRLSYRTWGRNEVKRRWKKVSMGD